MFRWIKLAWNFIRIIARRVRTQGVRTTLQWIIAVGIPRLTGRLSLRYSRITPNLYLGPQYGQKGKLVLEDAGITASISLREEFDDAEHELQLADYGYFPIEDNTAPSLENLDEGVAFIRRVIQGDGSIYVHCGSGVGRAPTMVAAYLIAEGDTVHEAVEKIQHARPFIRILPMQIERLHEYENHVRSAAS